MSPDFELRVPPGAGKRRLMVAACDAVIAASRVARFGDYFVRNHEEPVEPVKPEPVKRTRTRRPTLASVARQAARAGIPVAAFEVRPDSIKVIPGKPAGLTDDDGPNEWDAVQ